MMDGIFEFLDVKEHRATVTRGRGHEKLDIRPIHDSISNYKELKDHFLQTRWNNYFTD